MTHTDTNKIAFTRVSNDINGNPRYVCHFFNLLTEAEKNDKDVHFKYEAALARAKKLGGKKFHNKQYGGGIAFQSYNIRETERDIIGTVAVDSKIEFLPTWGKIAHEHMDAAILAHFKNRVLPTNYGLHTRTHSFEAIYNILGLAYTSSSSFAMYSICNVELKYDEQYKYQWFAIGLDGKYYAGLWDKDENEKIIVI